MVRHLALRLPLAAAARRYTSTTSNSSSYGPENAQATTTKATTTTPQIIYKKYPFFVRRTTNGTLPVYTDLKNGRTRRLTIIRKVEGDVNALVSNLKEDFPKVPKDVFVSKPFLQQVVIKGHVRDEIMIWLAQKGF